MATDPAANLPEDAPLLGEPAEALPNRVTVAVIGGGVAALAIAEGLAADGADVALLAPGGRLGDSIDGRDIGLAAGGLSEHAHRLVAAIGPAGAADIYRWTDENRSLLGARGLLRPALRLQAAIDPREDADVAAAAAALGALGRPTTRLTPTEVAAHLGGTGFGIGLAGPDEGRVAPIAALQVLARGARRAGALLATSVPVRALRDVAGGTRVEHARGSLLADVVVLAGDWRMRDLDPWCLDKVFPVRVHYQRWGPVAEAAPALTAQQGWLFGGSDDSGGFRVSGARWATPHLEVGETGPDVQPKVSAALERVVQSRLPGPAAGGLTHRWAGIAAFTCDQLPVIGPVPGRASLVACFGWNGRPWSLALRAAAAVVQGLVEGKAQGVPGWFSARRFVG